WRYDTLLTKLHILLFLRATASPDIYPLSLHDALPILQRDRADAVRGRRRLVVAVAAVRAVVGRAADLRGAALTRAREQRVHRDADRKSTRLNSSHVKISYAVFCLKKKKKTKQRIEQRA